MILRITLPNTIRNRSNNNNPPTISEPNRFKQPAWIKQKYRQDPIPPIFYRKRHPRIRNHNHIIIDTSPKGTLHSRIYRQIYASKLSSITSTYPTRMIRPIGIRGPMINPKQTRRDKRISNIRLT